MGRQQRKEFREYLNKYELGGYTFAVNPSPSYSDRLYAFPGDTIYGNYHRINSIPTLVRAIKRAKVIKLWTGCVEKKAGGIAWRSKPMTHQRNTYQEFKTFDEFREYCLIIRLSGL